jgi:hypothetical protein
MQPSTPSIWREVGLPDLGPEHLHVYALIDAAQVPRFATLSLPKNRLPVLGEPIAPDRFAATPHLFSIGAPEELQRIVMALATATSSHGALSVLVGSASLPKMADAIRRRMDLTLPDGLACMNRFFDGRVAPHFVEALTAEQRLRFCSFASQWWVVGHDLRWRSLVSEERRPDPFDGPLELNERQQAQLVDACYPYAVIDHFERTDAELLQRLAPARRYAVFDTALQEAARYGVGEGADGIFFCTLVLTRGEHFYQSSAWQEALTKIQRKQLSLHDAAKAIHD